MSLKDTLNKIQDAASKEINALTLEFTKFEEELEASRAKKAEELQAKDAEIRKQADADVQDAIGAFDEELENERKKSNNGRVGK